MTAAHRVVRLQPPRKPRCVAVTHGLDVPVANRRRSTVATGQQVGAQLGAGGGAPLRKATRRLPGTNRID